MNVHEFLIIDHHNIRRKLADVQAALGKDTAKLEKTFLVFQKDVGQHFRREDVYYRVLDDGKRVTDRGLMHDVRNDHAAIIFTLESLAIRLRKTNGAGDWKKKFDNLTKILLGHLEREEKDLFPQAEKLLTPAAWANILQEMNNLQ